MQALLINLGRVNGDHQININETNSIPEGVQMVEGCSKRKDRRIGKKVTEVEQKQL